MMIMNNNMGSFHLITTTILGSHLSCGTEMGSSENESCGSTDLDGSTALPTYKCCELDKYVRTEQIDIDAAHALLDMANRGRLSSRPAAYGPHTYPSHYSTRVPTKKRRRSPTFRNPEVVLCHEEVECEADGGRVRDEAFSKLEEVREGFNEEVFSKFEEVRAWFREEEVARYMEPERAFKYTAVDGRKTTVGPMKKCGGKPSVKARDHFMLKSERPPHVTILCIVRDAAARMAQRTGTRSDVCGLVRHSQYIVEGISDKAVNQVVSKALDRLHYELDPCVRYDRGRRVWVYLHGEKRIRLREL